MMGSRLLRRRVRTAAGPAPIPPTITLVSPSSGLVNAAVAITGTGYDNTSAVTFNGTPAVITVNSLTSITTSVPAGATSGQLRVTTSGGFAESAFTVNVLSGDYAYLFDSTAGALLPLDVGTGLRMAPNTTTGLHDGTAVDTTEPVWAFTVALTDTGNASTNLTNLQAAIDTQTATMTGNTKITMPASFRALGRIFLRRNATGFWLGLMPAVTAGLPAHVVTTAGATHPRKVNRIAPATHLSLMPAIERQFNGEPALEVELCDVRKYWIRGIQILNPSNVSGFTNVAMYPSSITLAGRTSVVASTANSITFNAGTTATSFSGLTLWIHRGVAATQVFHNVNYNGTTKVLTLDGSDVWATTPTTASELEFFTQNKPAGAPAITDTARFFAEDVHFIQCYHNGGTGQNVTRAYYATGRRIAICDGFTESMGTAGQDSQDVFIYAGAGPFKYTNCESQIGGAKENIIIGGASLVGLSDEHLPSNVEIRYHKFRNAGYGSPKCSVELKYGRYVLIEATDASDQTGGSFVGEYVIKLTDQGGNNAGVDTRYITIRLNRVANSGGLAQLTSFEGYVGPNVTRNVSFVGNVQVNTPTANEGITVSGLLQNFTIDHNTVCGSAATGEFARLMFFADANVGGYSSGPNIRVRRNVFAGPQSGVWSIQGGGGFFGNAGMLPVLGTGSEISNNLCTTADATNYSLQLRANGDYDSANIGFVDRAGGNVALAASSLGFAAASGKDIGADVVLVNAILADVV